MKKLKTGLLRFTIIIHFFFLTFLVSCQRHTPEMQADTSNRLSIRNMTAVEYTNPESHLKLARYHYETGNKVQAFFISEKTREMFGDEAFEPAFKKIARVKMTESPEFKTEKDQNEFCKSHPDSFEAFMADKRQQAKNKKITNEEGEKIIEEAMAKYPNQYELKAMAAKYYLKGKKDYETALYLYIDLYFNNPHFYDWEYAEFRIKEITSSKKKEWFENRIKSGISIDQMAAKEKNPRVLDVLIDQAKENWDASMVQIMFTLMGNDDPYIQTSALHRLLEHSADVSDKERIRSMLKGDDLVKRAMAAFLVVKCLGEKEYPLLKDNLDSGIELIQIDTIQALSKMGGEAGIKYLRGNPPAKNEAMYRLWKEETAILGKGNNK